MPMRRLTQILAISAFLLITAVPAQSYVPYYIHVRFMETLNADIIKLLPRAMGHFIYQNRVGFARGMTFVNRQIRTYPLKMRDLEEIRKTAYGRLMRDIPYCIAAFKGGEIKLDTSASNLSARLGMIAYWTVLQKMPAFPDMEYLEKFVRYFEELIADNLINVWVFYDGYGDFNSLGELMERLKEEGMPTFVAVPNYEYPVHMRHDTYAMFRAPRKFNSNMVFTDVEIMHLYNTMVNAILDVYVYIWKCSGMDLSHPSYPIPPGTIVSRPSRRRQITGGTLTRITARTTAREEASRTAEEEAEEAEQEEEEAVEDESEEEVSPEGGAAPSSGSGQ